MLRSTCLLLVTLYVLLQPFSSHCICSNSIILQRLEAIESKLDDVLQDRCAIETDCIENTREASTVTTPKKVITGIHGAHYVLFTKSNDVFITGFFDGQVYRYDLAGNFKDKFGVPGNPTMMDIRGNILYITNHADAVYTKDISIIDSPVTKTLTLDTQPIGIKISDDGKRLYVGLDGGVIRVFNENLVKIGEMKINDRSRKILLDADGNINVGSYSSKIYVFNRNYQLVRIDQFSAGNIDGYLNNCDGSRILADRSGKIIFVDKNRQTVKTIAIQSPSDVNIAPDDDLTLWVADPIGNKVYLY